ncbi:thioredoxin domain-containing protein [Escherichia coli]|nr:thioredoxin domain-containing protein [Escherichia coli]EGB2977673.1 thioredoxin domain-containing protein [Escherichia coli]
MFRQLMLLLFCGLSIACMPTITRATVPVEGKDYTVIKTPVKDAPSVVEFFSFYCPPCAAFSGRYQVSKAVENILPPGEKVVKYHVDTMGPFGMELTEAWSVATVLGVEDKVELPLFVAVQINRSIRTEASIRQVFIEAGVSARDYDAARDSLAVRALTVRQQEAVKAYDVMGTPSFFVNGKYRVNNGAIRPSGAQDYGQSFADMVSALLKQQGGESRKSAAVNVEFVSDE